MIPSQKFVVGIPGVFCIFTLFCADCSGDRVSHYETALELFSTVKEYITSEYIDSIVEYILVQEPEYKKSKMELQSIIQKFIYSDEFKELWLQALIYFFSENEIKEITIKLNNPNYHHSTVYQSALIKKYEDVFKNLKNKFIEMVRLKLNKKKEK